MNIGFVAARAWIAALAVLAAGCAHQEPTLYGWGDYQAQVYQYLDGSKDGVAMQIGKLEESRERISAAGAALPPGFQLHLAMLYAIEGQMDKVQDLMAAEQASFPESSTFVVFMAKTLAARAETGK